MNKGDKYLSKSDGRTRKVERLFRHKTLGDMVEMVCVDCEFVTSTEMTVKEVEKLLKWELWSKL